MRGTLKCRKFLTIMLALGVVGVACAQADAPKSDPATVTTERADSAKVEPIKDDPMNDPEVQKLLRGMADASTWYHPDLFGEFAGLRYYAHKNYAGALKYFEIGAFYADKLSQLSLGLMYMNGEGTKKDPVTAFAWLDLAAEREYPDFVATRDNLKATLTPDQLAQAMQLRSKLAEKYADAVAKPRLALQFRLAKMEMTGSRTGYDSGVMHVQTKPTCGPSVSVGGQGVPQAGCGSSNIYAKERWDPDLYFASRDRQFKATVTVGDVEEKDKPATNPAAPASVDPAAGKGVQKQ